MQNKIKLSFSSQSFMDFKTVDKVFDLCHLVMLFMECVCQTIVIFTITFVLTTPIYFNTMIYCGTV